MNIKQITDSLAKIYQEENKRIVFWYDGEGEFEEILPTLDLANVSIVRLEETPSLELKIRMEMDDTANRFLLYSSGPEPAPEEDWLLDIRLYSRSFRADATRSPIATRRSPSQTTIMRSPSGAAPRSSQR